MHPFRDPPKSVRPVIHGVHACHDRQQHLRRADVAGGFIPADVLLPCLQGEPVGCLPTGIARHADDASWKLAGVCFLCGQERGVRSSEPERHTESLA